MTQGHAEPGSAHWFVDLASGSGVVFFALQVKPELRFEFINPAVEDLLGYSEEDVLSDPLVMLGRIDPRDAELLARDLEVALDPPRRAHVAGEVHDAVSPPI